jgi:hypothetical protein
MPKKPIKDLLTELNEEVERVMKEKNTSIEEINSSLVEMNKNRTAYKIKTKSNEGSH